MKPPRVHWDAVAGWVVDTDLDLMPHELQACVNFTRKVQTDRILAMPRGDRREQAERALSELSVGTLRQNVRPASPWERDRIVFSAR